MTSEQQLMVAIVSLAGVVAILWAVVIANYKKLEKRTEVCEQDRLNLWKTISELRERVGECAQCTHKGQRS